jgi:hypothetical protein
VRLSGFSAPNGFYLYGAVTTPQVRSAVQEALVRLSGGERHLAIHPRCGTNVVTAGILVGVTSFLSMLPGDERARRTRLPLVLLLSTLAILVAQPLGLAVQQHVTTEANLAGINGLSIERRQFRQTPVHRVQLRHS